MNKTHAIKVETKEFKRLKNGGQTLEVGRQGTINFITGDIIKILEWCDSRNNYTGREANLIITHLTNIGCKPGSIKLGLKKYPKR